MQQCQPAKPKIVGILTDAVKNFKGIVKIILVSYSIPGLTSFKILYFG